MPTTNYLLDAHYLVVGSHAYFVVFYNSKEFKNRI